MQKKSTFSNKPPQKNPTKQPISTFVATSIEAPLLAEVKSNIDNAHKSTSKQSSFHSAKVLTVLTLISSMWGIAISGWITWNYLSGNETKKMKQHAKMVAAEVSKTITTNGALAPAEKSLLLQIRDHFDRLITSTSVATNQEAKKSIESELDKKEQIREHSTALQARIKASPTLNFNVKYASTHLPMKIESLSYFHLNDRDIVRVDIGNPLGTLVTGEVIAVAKYKVDGHDVTLACCGSNQVLKDSNTPITSSGIMFRAKNFVTKHLDILIPNGKNVQLSSVKIGFLTPFHPSFVFSEWMNVTNSGDQEHVSLNSPESPQAEQLPPVDTTESAIETSENTSLSSNEPTDEEIQAAERAVSNAFVDVDDIVPETVHKAEVSGPKTAMSQAMEILSNLKNTTSVPSATEDYVE